MKFLLIRCPRCGLWCGVYAVPAELYDIITPLVFQGVRRAAPPALSPFCLPIPLLTTTEQVTYICCAAPYPAPHSCPPGTVSRSSETMGEATSVPFPQLLDRVMTPDREVILTTMSVDADGMQIKVLQQWTRGLGHRRRNALVVSPDERSCSLIRTQASLPCHVDERPAPRRSGQKSQPAAFDLKWRYLRDLTRMNISTLFADSDVAWFRDPLGHWDKRFDVQGLSDVRSVHLSVGKFHEITCRQAFMERHYGYVQGKSVYPCQSAGIVFVVPSLASVSFLSDQYEYLLAHPAEWDQWVFQLMVMRYTIGLGDELPPLRYRLRRRERRREHSWRRATMHRAAMR